MGRVVGTAIVGRSKGDGVQWPHRASRRASDPGRRSLWWGL